MTNQQAAEELVSLYALYCMKCTAHPNKRTAVVMAISALIKNEDYQPDVSKII